MSKVNQYSLRYTLSLFIAGALLLQLMSSCGKQGAASPTGLNVQYHVLNLSPDLRPVNLYIDFKLINQTPVVFNSDQGYFFVPSLDTPYQIRSALTLGTPILSRHDLLKTRSIYSLYIVGAVADSSLTTIFTVDTGSVATLGRGKLRFVNASPTETKGLDVTANGTQAFKHVTYKQVSDYIELPVGNYDLQISQTGNSSILRDIPVLTIKDGRLYTLYTYGYSTRTDSAAFNANVITNPIVRAK